MVMFATFITQTCRLTARSSQLNRGIVIDLWPSFGDPKILYPFFLLPRFAITRQETGDEARLWPLARHYRFLFAQPKHSLHLARLVARCREIVDAATLADASHACDSHSFDS